MYLIVGGTGYLGRYLIKNLLRKTEEPITATFKSSREDLSANVNWIKCDIQSDKDLIYLYSSLKKKTLKVIFLSAYHNPDLIENNIRLAWDINIVSLSKFLKIFDNIESLYYPSTEVVYGESFGVPFNEQSKLNPVNSYGRMKPVAEGMVNFFGFNVVRLPVLYGHSLSPRRPHFFDQVIYKLKNNIEVEMFQDQVRNLLNFDTAARLMIQLQNNKSARLQPIVNIGSDFALSKYDLAIRMCEYFDLNKDLVKPITMDSGKVFLAKRAKETLLDNSLLKSILKLEKINLEFGDGA